MPEEKHGFPIQTHEHDALLNAMEQPFPVSQGPHAPVQSIFTAQNTPNDALDTGPAVPGSDSVSTRHIAVDMAATVGAIRPRRGIECQHPDCTSTFGRAAERNRHYRTLHALRKPEFWCSDPTCERSRGGRAFTRSDKLREHERKRHHADG